MSEDERQEMLRTVAEAHLGIREIALRLRRRLPAKVPATKATVRAEEEVFRLRRELLQLELSEPDPAEGRHGGKVIDISRLRRGKDRGSER